MIYLAIWVQYTCDRQTDGHIPDDGYYRAVHGIAQ